MLVAMAEGMMTNGAEVAAWVSVVVVGMVRRMAVADRRTVQAQALRLLLDIGMMRRRRPVALNDAERALAACLSPESDAAALIAELRVAPERLASMCVRILHSLPVKPQPARR